jgi:preprotein translocase subunit SecA
MDVMEKFVAGKDEATRSAASTKYLAEVQKRVDRINELEPTIEDLGDDELQAKSEEFKARLQKGEDINGPLLEEAFAVVREAAWYVRLSFTTSSTFSILTLLYRWQACT